MIDDDFLRAAPPVIALLAASDRSTWDRLLAPIAPLPPDEACPPVLLRALLAVDDPKGWRARCDGAYVGSAPWDAGAGHYVVDPWLARGVLREISDPRLRYEALLIEAGPDATRLTRELVRDAGKASDAPLLANALVLLAHRLGEDREHAAAIDAAKRAEEIFARLGDEGARVRAVRMRGAALLRLRRIDDALAVLDVVRDAPSSTRAWREAAHAGADDPFSAAGAVAERDTDSERWFIELAKVAAHASHRVAAERAAVGLRLSREREAERARAERERQAARRAAEAGRAAEAAVARESARREAFEKQQRDDAAKERAPDGSIVEKTNVRDEGAWRVWEWHVRDSFNPRYDAGASERGLSYACEIQGPFCGYDALGEQTWEEFLAAGPLPGVRMPPSIEADIRAYALARQR